MSRRLLVQIVGLILFACISLGGTLTVTLVYVHQRTLPLCENPVDRLNKNRNCR